MLCTILMYGSNLMRQAVSHAASLKMVEEQLIEGVFVPLRRIVSKSGLYIRGVTHSGHKSMNDKASEAAQGAASGLKPFTLTIISTRICQLVLSGTHWVLLSYLGSVDPKAKLGMCHPVVPAWPPRCSSPI